MPASTSFDPVEVSSARSRTLSTRNVTEALAAIAAAADLDALKAARLAHDGDRSPLALANREIGALPPAARRPPASGSARPAARSERRSTARPGELEAERDARVLIEETVDVTPAVGPPSRGRPASADHDPGAVRRRVHRDGLRGRRRPRGRGRVVQLRRAEHGARPPGPVVMDTFFVGSDGLRAWCCAPTPRRCRPGRCSPGRRRSTSCAPARCSAPTSWTPPTRRSSTSSRGWWSTRASRWRT